MKILNDIERAYFIGAGGIGMSALARYMRASAIPVAGYDRVSTTLTDALAREGIQVHFSDDVSLIPSEFKNRQGTLVVLTPAIPEEHSELTYFRKNNFRIMKRSEVLGLILNSSKGIAVAGTHGKTTVSSMIAHIMDNSAIKCNAFLGGLSKNLDSNILLNSNAEFTIAEADEFDRSFLKLYPVMAIVTSMDPDHLDIYGNFESMVKDYNRFLGQVKEGGRIIYREGLSVEIPAGTRAYTYHLNSSNADFYIEEYRQHGFSYRFDLITPGGKMKDLILGVYGKLNLVNAVGAIAACFLSGASEAEIREGIKSYSGVKRRFEVLIEEKNRIMIDDYAHHPVELKAFISSVREAIPGKKLTGVFQPHLFSRTRDFATGFSESLSLLDHVILLDIYPAREAPIPEITSEIIFRNLKNEGEKIMTTKEHLLKVLKELDPEVLLLMGAGDIEQLVEPAKEQLQSLEK